MGLFEITISAVMFVTVVIGLGTVLGDAVFNSGATLPSQLDTLNSTYDIYGITEDGATKQKKNLDGSGVDPTNQEAAAISSIFTITTDAIQAMNTTKQIVNQVSEDANIPPLFTRVARVVLVFLFVFMVASVVWRWSFFRE